MSTIVFPLPHKGSEPWSACRPVQIVDLRYAVRVVEGEAVTGPWTASADLKVAVVDGGAAVLADEKWEVVGACRNKPTIKVEFVTEVAAIFVETKVAIISGADVATADRRICITNAERLSDETRRALKLAED